VCVCVYILWVQRARNIIITILYSIAAPAGVVWYYYICVCDVCVCVCACAGIHAAEAEAEVRRLYYIFTVIVFVLSV
jgi:hypothetical protein